MYIVHMLRENPGQLPLLTQLSKFWQLLLRIFIHCWILKLWLFQEEWRMNQN